MKTFRVAVERTYRDVAVVYVQAEDSNAAELIGEKEAQNIPPTKRDVCGNFERCSAIEVDEEPGEVAEPQDGVTDAEQAQRIFQPDQ